MSVNTPTMFTKCWQHSLSVLLLWGAEKPTGPVVGDKTRDNG